MKKHRICILCSGIVCIMMLIYPQLTVKAASKGIGLWFEVVLPSLLPFFICANFMGKIGVPRLMGQVFEPVIQKVFAVPGEAAFPFFMSITSGYPVGAKITADMVKNGIVTKNQGARMLSFCSTSGPLFMLGAVGSVMLASPAAGWVIAISHYLGGALNGILHRFLFLDKKEKRKTSAKAEHTKAGHEKKQVKFSFAFEGSITDMLTDAMLGAMKTLGIVCGYLVLFMIFTSFLDTMGFFRFLVGCITTFVGNGYEQTIQGICLGFFEMTLGCSGVAKAGEVSLLWMSVIASGMISFGGLSVFAQTISMITGSGISAFGYFRAKVMHMSLSVGIALPLGRFLLEGGGSVATLSNSVDIGGEGFIYHLLFSSGMVIIVLSVTLILMGMDKINERK